MTVCVIGVSAGPDGWAETAAGAVALAGNPVRSILTDAGGDITAAIADETRVILASSATPLDLIVSAFATAPGRTARKIVDIASAHAAEAAVLSLFDVADMLIFTPQALAAALGLTSVPTDIAALSVVQPLLVRPNQAAVVRFAGSGAAAVWADRTLFVAGAVTGDPARAEARFCGTIAAAVAQGIGPEPALTMALAAAAATELG